MRILTVSEVKYIAHKLAKELMKFDEPIPEFETRYPDVLERCLNAPHQTFSKRALYRGTIKKSAFQFYLMIKNHPFQNGNKRIAVMTLLYYLYTHKKWLKMDNQELYNFARWVAESNPRVRKHVIEAIEHILKEDIIVL